jgi:hypothetical protein
MNKQDKQTIIADFKKVIEKLKLHNGNGFICNQLEKVFAKNISIKYFKESKSKAEQFTLDSNIPKSWVKYDDSLVWWMYPQTDSKTITSDQVVDLKISFLESLIKELEEE